MFFDEDGLLLLPVSDALDVRISMMESDLCERGSVIGPGRISSDFLAKAHANLAAWKQAYEILTRELKVYTPEKKISAETMTKIWDDLKGL